MTLQAVKTTVTATLTRQANWHGILYQPGTQELPLDLAIAEGLVTGYETSLLTQSDFYAIGGAGPKLITGTAAVTGKFYRIDFIEATQINQIQGLEDTYNGVTFPALYVLDSGRVRTITSIQLSSGACVAYME